MQAIWYFDVISPYAYLALDEVEELSQLVPVSYQPILFAALLKHHGQLGPAEMPTKRLHTYRLCTFEAQRRAVPFRFPPVHPFKPLRALRLLCEANGDPAITRRVFEHIWRERNDPNDDVSWSRLLAELDVDASDPSATPLDLRANTQNAIDAGVFGVPTLAIGGQIFWGVDALPMARAFIADPALFEAGEMERLSVIENPLLSPARGASVG